MDNNGVINMEDEVEKFCVSFVSIMLANFGLNKVVASWNSHRIPGNNIWFSQYQLSSFQLP